MFFFVQALQNNRRASWILHTTCNLLLVFTHLFTAYIFAVQWCYLVLFRRSALRAWTLAHGVIAVLLLLWLKTVDMPQLDGAASWIVQPGLRELVMVLLIFIGGRPSNASPVNHLPTNISLDIPLALAAMVVIGVFVIKTGISKEDSSAKKDKKAVVLLLLWALLPFVALVAMSFLWRPCFVYRYILYSSLPLYLMLGAGFSTMRNKRLACVLGAALMLVWAHQLSAITTGPFRADWRSASRYLEQNANPNDTVVVFQRFNVESLEFNSTLPEDQIEPVDVWSAICDPVTAAQQKGEAYLVVRMWSDPAKIEACFPENSLAFTYTDFKGWPALRVYHITRDHGAAAQ